MRRLKWFAVLAALLFVAGCGGSDSGGGGGGSTTPPGFVIEGGDIVTTATEACAGCHDGANNDVNVVDAHSGGGADVERDVEITDINITAGNEVTVTVNVQVAGTTTNVTDLSGYDLRFIFAELIAGTGGDGAYWENIFDPTDPTYERANTNPFGFDDSDAANGNYTYTFGDADGATVFTSLNAQTNTHRIGVQVSEGISNGVWDFVPTTGAITPDGDIASSTVTGTLANDIVRNDACNACHAEGGARTSTGGNTGIAMHGGSRVEVQYCITCHNPGLENSQIPDDYHFTGSVAENVDMKTMIHKLHMGKGLPSVKGGGSYAAGSGSRSHDYSTGGFPQSISNCEKCHDEGGTGAEDTAWRFNPSKEVCGTCHDRTTWEGAGEPSGGDLSGDGKSSFTLHAKGSYDLPNGFAVSSNSSCAGCHASGSGNSYDIDVTHLRQSDVATAVGASPIVFNIGSINLVGSAEGLPTVATLTVASGTATLTFDSAPLLPILPGAKITLAGSPNTNYNGEHTVLTVNGAGDQVTFSTTASSSLTDATVVYATRREDEVQIEFWVDDDGLYDGGEYQLTNTIGVAVSGITRTGTATKDDESGIYDTATITFAADVSGILSANDWIGVYNADSDSKRFNGTFEVISVATTLVTYEMRWSSTDTTPPTTAVVSTGKSFVVDTGPFGLGGASSLYMHIGWTGNGTDYTNPDASGGSTPGEPLTFSALQAYIGATKDVKEVNSLLAGGTGYAYVLTTTIGDADGQGIFVIAGHPALVINGKVERVPVTSAYQEFDLGDGLTNRRAVVDAASCVDCHETLSLHGDNRVVDTGTGSVVICMVCHNTANTDINRRPASGGDFDGLAEQAIDFKYMIHRIHKGRDTEAGGIEVYGYGGSDHVFAGEFPPGRELSNCENCHDSAGAATYAIPLVGGIEGTTIDSGDDVVDHDDDLNISPTTAACSACHDEEGELVHMQVMGGNLSVLEEDILFY